MRKQNLFKINMAEFDKALDKVLYWEGGLVDDKDDLGGLTNRGITLSVFNHYFEGGREGLKNITDSQVRVIYSAGFWSKIWGNYINSQSVAELLFDFAVNSGVKIAVKKIQILVGTEPDGVMGPKTIAEINRKDPKILFNELYDTRVAYYKLIVQNRPKNAKFLKGWMRRLKSYTFEK